MIEGKDPLAAGKHIKDREKIKEKSAKAREAVEAAKGKASSDWSLPAHTEANEDKGEQAALVAKRRKASKQK